MSFSRAAYTSIIRFRRLARRAPAKPCQNVRRATVIGKRDDSRGERDCHVLYSRECADMRARRMTRRHDDDDKKSRNEAPGLDWSASSCWIEVVVSSAWPWTTATFPCAMAIFLQVRVRGAERGREGRTRSAGLLCCAHRLPPHRHGTQLVKDRKLLLDKAERLVRRQLRVEACILA